MNLTDRGMIYLDSAATSLQKPPQVARAMQRAMQTMASPGRGGHRAAMLAAETAYLCRTEIAEMFGVSEPERVIFTMNATHAINIALSALVRPGDRVVVSGYEHNAVMRCLQHLGADVDVVHAPLFAPERCVEGFGEKIHGAKAVVLCHVSNVFGYIQPLEDIARLCLGENVPLLVDASQSAGSIRFDFDRLGLQFAAFPGHKGLLGPQGTGVLLCRDTPPAFICGGTGSDSLQLEMPDYLPDRLEAGTHNMPGIAGLLEGVRWVKAKSPSRILQHERKLMNITAQRLSRHSGIELFRADQAELQAGVLSLRVRGIDCESLAQKLTEAGLAVRAGYHCAPLAHESAGTLDSGTIRLSFSPFNTAGEAEKAADLILKSLKFL